jgi:ABC-type dipeptide/oligopeptide/nickel transport system permease subunit
MAKSTRMSATQAKAAEIADALAYRERSLWQDAATQFVKNRLAVGGFVVIVVFIFAAVFGPYLAPYDFLKQDILNALQPPSFQHWLGTDELGRDIFSRLLYGARTAALLGFSATSVGLLLGILAGTTAGFLGGRVDQFIMWVSDLVQSIPGLLLAMLVNTSLRRPVVAWFDAMYTKTKNPAYLNTLWLDYVLVFGALTLISWPGTARLIRGLVLSLRETDYVTAARAVGARTMRIMFSHIVPNALGPLVVSVSAGLGNAIINEAGLSFLGLGVQPPNASWGSMLNKSLSLWQSYPHLLVAPAVTIGIIKVAFVFLGDGLNDALNPHQRRV